MLKADEFNWRPRQKKMNSRFNPFFMSWSKRQCSALFSVHLRWQRCCRLRDDSRAPISILQTSASTHLVYSEIVANCLDAIAETCKTVNQMMEIAYDVRVYPNRHWYWLWGFLINMLITFEVIRNDSKLEFDLLFRKRSKINTFIFVNRKKKIDGQKCRRRKISNFDFVPDAGMSYRIAALPHSTTLILNETFEQNIFSRRRRRSWIKLKW